MGLFRLLLNSILIHFLAQQTRNDPEEWRTIIWSRSRILSFFQLSQCSTHLSKIIESSCTEKVWEQFLAKRSTSNESLVVYASCSCCLYVKLAFATCCVGSSCLKTLNVSLFAQFSSCRCRVRLLFKTLQSRKKIIWKQEKHFLEFSSQFTFSLSWSATPPLFSLHVSAINLKKESS